MRYGIIGCGNRFYKFADAIKKNPDSRLVSVFDVKPERAREAAIRYNCEFKADPDGIFQDPSIDVVIISTPHDTHKDLVLKTLEAKKYCVCEKPLCLSVADCNTILENKHFNNNVIVCLQTRFSLAIQRLFKHIKAGELGNIHFCSVVVRKRRDEHYFRDDWHSSLKRSGGMLFTQGIHALDHMLEICGEPEKISGLRKNFRSFKEMEDLFVGHVKFKNGIIGNIEVTTFTKYPEDNSILVVGDRGSIKVSGQKFENIEYLVFNGGNHDITPEKLEEVGNCDDRFLSAVNEFILNHSHSPFLPLIEEGTRSIAFIESLYRNSTVWPG